MLKVADNPSFTHTVKVQTPVDGGHKEETFKATFAVMPVSKMQGFDLTTEEGTRGMLEEVLVEAGDLVGDDGKTALDWNTELRDQLLDMPHVRGALFETYQAALSKARAGN